ncbi:MAG: MOSC domain-containing protein [Deltaproteobacteria bacterium]|nr:MOSC domain-containing protein [Deltaproteobacteria bacterium]
MPSDPAHESRIASIAISKRKGTPKETVAQASLLIDHGIEGDAHAGPWHRQVSFLAAESIDGVREIGLDVDFGSFAENIATTGIDWETIHLGTRIALGDTAMVEITQKGKECHNRCAIYYLAGDCIMPREGVFGKVIKGGTIQCGDPIHIIERP